MALKEMSEKTGLSIGSCANLMIVSTLFTIDKTLSTYSPDTQKALAADTLAALSEILKQGSLEAVKNTSFADIYKTLLGQPKK